MTTEIVEESPAPKVVNWDVAEEKEFEKLKSEMDKYKDKIIELDSKADDLRSKLDRKWNYPKPTQHQGSLWSLLNTKGSHSRLQLCFTKSGLL